MTALEAEFLARKAQVSPLNTIRSLLESFKSIQAETLMSQASHLRPMLEELCTLGDSYMQMMDAVSDGEGTEHAAKRPEKKRTRGK